MSLRRKLSPSVTRNGFANLPALLMSSFVSTVCTSLSMRARSGAQTFCHVLSGLNCFIALAMAAPFGPRFFWYTTPS